MMLPVLCDMSVRLTWNNALVMVLTHDTLSMHKGFAASMKSHHNESQAMEQDPLWNANIGHPLDKFQNHEIRRYMEHRGTHIF